MCGICGIIGSEEPSIAAARVRAMMNAMAHRGPDGEGALTFPGVSFGMRRLSIIDIPGGQQPIWNEDGTLAVIFNGEIYNFRELRAFLENHGHRFSTLSDTETIVHAYEMWGSECARHLRGMFAFAVVEFSHGRERHAQRVFLARDRVGIKPLYYAFAGNCFLFASELRSLLASGGISRHLSPEAVSGYLLFGCACEPMSMVQGISSIPPGYCGYVPADKPLSFDPKPYWGVSDATTPPHSPASAASEQVRTDLEDSVRCHLIADVPVGIFLSSGLDSTTLAAIATKQKADVKTFTVAFTEEGFNEAALARSTAERLGAEHSEFILTGNEMLSRLDEAISGFDQPSADGLNTYFVSWAACQAGLKVALSGLGSDEIFGGYASFRDTLRLSRLMRVGTYFPTALRKGAARATLSIYRGRRSDSLKKAASAFVRPDGFPHPYFFTRALFTTEAAATLLKSSESWNNSAWWGWFARIASQADGLDAFTAVSWLELRSYLVNMLLRDTDAMSMRHSLEVRVPFLDDPLLRTVLSYPQSTKKGGLHKALLAGAVRDLVPSDVIRRRKRTFTLPWEVWLRGPLRQQVQTSLANCDPRLKEIIDIDAVMNIWRGFLAGRGSWSRPWSFFVLNEWTKRNITEGPRSFVSGHTAAAPVVP